MEIIQNLLYIKRDKLKKEILKELVHRKSKNKIENYK